MDEVYNDIQPWNYNDIPKTFGAEEGKVKTFRIKTKEQADKLFKDNEFNAASVLQFVELYIPKKDAPRALVLTAEASAKTNAKQ
jgi:pyruvate decarboxylase